MARDIEQAIGDTALERGDVLRGDKITGRVYGPEGAPVIVIMGGISASRFVADGGRHNRGWWSTLVHKGGPIDLNKYQVIGYDFAPDPQTDNRPGTITTTDQARRLNAMLDSQGITRVAAMIGSSYGGMTALQFARYFPEALGRLCVIGAAHKPYPIGVAWRGIQRRIVRLGLEAGLPKEGLKLARELAMTTYRTPVEFADRFTLDETAQNPSVFDICDYLGSRGDAFAELMDAERFLALSESIDLHRVEPEDISTPTLLMGAISDQLAPLGDMQELRDRLGGPSELYTFTSLFGHDAFLKEYDAMAPRLEVFCQEACDMEAANGQ
ncbi:MAG: homoserine O-succinyltransferase MetX [Maricaulaceae bacterium]